MNDCRGDIYGAHYELYPSRGRVEGAKGGTGMLSKIRKMGKP